MSENGKIDLKPCPFCGGRAVGIRKSTTSESCYAVDVRHTDKCFLRYAIDPYVSFDKKILMRKWNDRWEEKKSR